MAEAMTYCVVSCSTSAGTAAAGRVRVVFVESRVKARTGFLGRRQIALAGWRVNVTASSERMKRVSKGARWNDCHWYRNASDDGSQRLVRRRRVRSMVAALTRALCPSRNAVARRRLQTRKELCPGFGWNGHNRGEVRGLCPSHASLAKSSPSAVAISDKYMTPKNSRHRSKARS
jgi:hypothetical protein